MKICHISIVHSRNDIRIFYKECNSLKEAGHEVSYVVADGKQDEELNGIKIYSVRKPENRIERMLKTTKLAFEKAKSLTCDVCHLHDPELIPIGKKLKKDGIKVIFDSHEDIPMQILSKEYLSPFIRNIGSRLFSKYQRWSFSKFDTIVGATPYICEKISQNHRKTININNYPKKNEFLSIGKNRKFTDSNTLIYLGGITEERGIKEIIKALPSVKNDIVLKLAGEFKLSSFRKELISEPGWDYVEELGFLHRDKLYELLLETKVGLVTYLPIENHIKAQPNKLFEYMSANIPVIASNFSLWKQIVEDNDCGLCVNPENSSEIAEAIDWIINNPDKAKSMGQNGRKAVEEKYNWETEKDKLIALYNNL